MFHNYVEFPATQSAFFDTENSTLATWGGQFEKDILLFPPAFDSFARAQAKTWRACFCKIAQLKTRKILTLQKL